MLCLTLVDCGTCVHSFVGLVSWFCLVRFGWFLISLLSVCCGSPPRCSGPRVTLTMGEDPADAQPPRLCLTSWSRYPVLFCVHGFSCIGPLLTAPPFRLETGGTVCCILACACVVVCRLRDRSVVWFWSKGWDSCPSPPPAELSLVVWLLRYSIVRGDLSIRSRLLPTQGRYPVRGTVAPRRC